MEQNFEKVKNLIEASKLSATDKKEFITLFSTALDEELKLVAELFEEDPAEIEKTWGNYALKKAAVASGDAGAWEQIIKDEGLYLKTIQG